MSDNTVQRITEVSSERQIIFILYMKNLNKLESHSPSNDMCQIWLKLA